jgi:ATP/maltotriose-dependent transcriptional regulator MalT
MSKRVALKYCGGCDPGFGRVELFTKVRAAAGDSVEWVSLDDPDFDTVLLIAGCDRACPEQNPEMSSYRVISIKHDRQDAAAIVKALLGKSEIGPP